MVTHYYRTLKDKELKVLDVPRNGTWTHVVAPSEAEVAALVELYHLDEAILEDAQDFFEVPRMEKSGGATYFFTRYPYDERDEDIDTAPLLLVVGETFVLTLALREVPQFRRFAEGKTPILTTQKTKLFIQLMETIVTAFEGELVRLRRVVHRDRIKLRNIGPREIQRLVNYENELNNLLAAIVPTNTWLHQVTSTRVLHTYEEDKEMLEDLVIATGQLIDSSRAVLKTIQTARNASEAIMTSKLNKTIQTLTVITIILTLPTIVASLYGMNVPLPGMESAVAFPLILLAIGALVAGAFLLFKKNGWL